jgi:GNAT superfamily N-acetyltransferase
MTADVFAVSAADRPDLWAAAEAPFRALWPEYNHHGVDAGLYFRRLVPAHASLQFLLCDTATHEPVARGRSIPMRWDGTLEDLPTGIDAAGVRAVDEPEPTVLVALSAEVRPDGRGRGLSGRVLAEMVDRARRAGLTDLLAPVRPTRKERYPLIPIEAYAGWRRDDGELFDPWLRTHTRLGATVLRAEPRSMQIGGTVAEWESWTGLPLPADGDYIFPGGLAVLHVAHGDGSYWEPNVWMRHPVA